MIASCSGKRHHRHKRVFVITVYVYCCLIAAIKTNYSVYVSSKAVAAILRNDRNRTHLFDTIGRCAISLLAAATVTVNAELVWKTATCDHIDDGDW